ncbi:MAG: DUF1311 domain-containing protein [Pseudomonadota bacterium]|nr:DUF1311 domain-containing protein [Pseudomonadota bacterium]
MTTRMQRFPLALCGLLAVAAQAQAPGHYCGQLQPHPIDAAFAQATERSDGVTADMRDAQEIAYTAWDAELNGVYRGLMQRLGDGAAARALRQAQRAWLAWDRAETESDIAQVAAEGTSGPLIVSELARERRRHRSCTLQRAHPTVEAQGVD